MHFIEHIIEPERLLMTWQHLPDNQRYVVAELKRNLGLDTVSLKYLINTGDFQKAQEHGFDGYPAFPIKTETHTIGVLDALIRRLPPGTRSDFSQYLEGFRINPNTNLSEFALLGYTGAKLPTDGFSIIHPFNRAEGQFEFLLESTGYRFRNIPPGEIDVDNLVYFREELETIDNAQEKVIKIFANELHIGYVTRALLPSFQEWLSEGRTIKAWIEKKNGNPGQPVLYLYVQAFAK